MEFIFWIGAVFLVLGLAGGIDRAIFRYGPSWSRSFSTWLRRYRLRQLDRRVSVLTRRLGYERATPLGALRFTKSRAEEFGNGPPEA